MEFNEARNKLRRMGKAHLYELASNQGLSRCVIGGEECGLYFRHEGFGFCVSELLGQGCQVQRTKTLDNCRKDQEEKEPDPLLPLVEDLDHIETTMKPHFYPVALIPIPPAPAEEVSL